MSLSLAAVHSFWLCVFYVARCAQPTGLDIPATRRSRREDHGWTCHAGDAECADARSLRSFDDLYRE